MDKDVWMSDLKDKITTTASAAVRKSGELVEITRIKFAIMDTEGEIKKLLRDIGTIVYEARKNNTEIDDSINDKCEQIDELYEEIEEAQERLIELRSLQVCPDCGKKVKISCEYCPSCGSFIGE